ncbi:mechanosensitive ion channel family protein [Dyadobacter flavalbus]|uniref:Mechanosensitive ion channel family protein n=1 Tax=Dyadobacter flavalbus TaxID=2579942 RepID=A0A5M8R0W8_9BACT|nr:mechanosensitive ion channel family protein [Dyadobacter flavalbus]KAA6440634.1 mechanosensitive ion channel family protein [Dyadobacter flavalbus]
MILLQISKFIQPVAVKLESWAYASIRFVPNLIIAVIILVIFRYLSHYGSRITEKALTRASQNIALVSLISALTKIAIITTGLFFALGMLGLDKTVTSLLAGAGVLALALGFAFQDLTTNFISGAFIAIQRPIKVGDVIETNGFTGKVLSIGLRSVKMDNFAGQHVELPSKDIFQKPIVNFTYSGERRVQLLCSVANSENLNFVEGLVLSVINGLDFLQKQKPVELNFTKFGDNGIEFEVFFWIDQSKAGPGPAKSTAIKAVKKAFDENNIAIPLQKRSPEPTLQAKDQA